ncbi:protein phosphatase [Colletotrichum chrysophilum]|uniref:Protein phosphatase n=1 Tax=Colletotrichum chrysophilum TaxID=1836956 RepID=A0AAD9ASV6_9PEZI|nr:protein phosphatase [Colletotrichum chrysophilum]
MSRAYEESKSYRPRKSRSDSSYSQLRPKIIPITARSDYEGSIAAYDAGYAGEDGHYGYSSTIEGDEQYHAYPLRGSIIPGSQTKPLNSSEAPVTRSKIMPPIIESSKHQSRGKRDPTRTSNTQSATALANVCLNVFNTCCSRKSLEANHWIENPQADFNIWMAAMTDVRMAGLSSSFEFGLDVRPRELKLVKDLLVKLGSCLMECATIHGGDLLEESKRNVDSAIRNLTLLAIAIRHTRRKTRRFKLDDNSDSSALADLRKHLEYLILVDTTVFNDSTRQRHETQQLWWQDRSSDSLTPLQQRLIEANLRRRQRFLAAQQDSDQISRQHISSPIHAEETMSSITSVLDKVQSPSMNEKNIASPPAPGISTRPEFQPSLLATSPEASTSFTTGLCIDNESHDAETPQTQRSLIRTATDYPRLVMPRPQIEGDGHDNLHGTTVLKCPCCCETLPHSMLENESLWKDHLAADVNPYTCIAKDCPRPHVLYRSVAQWKAHVRKHHAKTWNCQLCDESDITTYTSPEQLSEHVREKHADSFPEQLLGTVSLWPCSISVGLDVCPLRSVTGQLDSPVLIRHILEHIHDFSLRSLPWADMPIEYEQGSTASGTYELSYLQQSEPADPSAPILPWRMHVWFEMLELPESEQWAQAESALNDLTLRRSVHKGVGNEGYFSRNDYFATDSGHVSLDVKLDESPSLRSYDSDFNFGSEHHEDAAAEMFEGNTKSEDKEDGRQNTKDIV